MSTLDVLKQLNLGAIAASSVEDPDLGEIEGMFRAEEYVDWDVIANAFSYEGFSCAELLKKLQERRKALKKTPDVFMEDMRVIIVMTNTRGTNISKITNSTNKDAWKAFDKIYKEYGMSSDSSVKTAITCGRVVLLFAAMSVANASKPERKIGPVEMSELPKDFPPCVRCTAFCGLNCKETYCVLGVFAIYHSILMTDKIYDEKKNKKPKADMVVNSMVAHKAAIQNTFIPKARKLTHLVELGLITVYSDEKKKHIWQRTNGNASQLYFSLRTELLEVYNVCKTYVNNYLATENITPVKWIEPEEGKVWA